MTPEGKVKVLVKRVLAAHGAYYFMPVSNGMGSMGVFDFVCCVNGVFLGVECKSDAKKKPTELQNRNAALVRASGGVALLIHIDNITVLVDTINQIKERPHGVARLSVWPANS